MGTVAALYVDSEGPYSQVPDVELWDAERDARLYRGPHPVVAHPPCKRWGNYWMGSPSNPHQFLLGDDGGCFAAALWCVRSFGGVLEHPENSRAWEYYGLPFPGWLGWGAADKYGGRSGLVYQGSYGHLSRKATWLYAVLPAFPGMVWVDCGMKKPVEHLNKRQRIYTPIPMRDTLLAMARTCNA